MDKFWLHQSKFTIKTHHYCLHLESTRNYNAGSHVTWLVTASYGNRARHDNTAALAHPYCLLPGYLGG